MSTCLDASKELQNLTKVWKCRVVSTCGGYRVKVVGVGGAGIKAVNRLIDSGQCDMECIAVDTDRQALEESKAPVKVEIEVKPAKGLCQGVANPEVGRQAAEVSKDRLSGVLHGADLVFVIAGMGGATGTGAAPVVAELARELFALTVGVVSRPFDFENSGKVREIAEAGISRLQKCVDALIIITSDALFKIDRTWQMNTQDAYHLMDNILGLPVQCILDLISVPSIISYDLYDLKYLFRSRTGMAKTGALGMGWASGKNQVVKATRMALSSPFLDKPAKDAQAVLMVFRTPEDFRILEIQEAADLIAREADPDVIVACNARILEKPAEEVRITAIWLYDPL